MVGDYMGNLLQWSCDQMNTGRDFLTLPRKHSHALHFSWVTGRKHPLRPAPLASLPLALNDPCTLICFPPLSNFRHWPALLIHVCLSFCPPRDPGVTSCAPPCTLAIFTLPAGLQKQPTDTSRLPWAWKTEHLFLSITFLFLCQGWLLKNSHAHLLHLHLPLLITCVPKTAIQLWILKPLLCFDPLPLFSHTILSSSPVPSVT